MVGIVVVVGTLLLGVGFVVATGSSGNNVYLVWLSFLSGSVGAFLVGLASGTDIGRSEQKNQEGHSPKSAEKQSE